ncbi:MAG: NAD(P)-dependent oxidoreductase [Acidobacteriota bacterium]|nr:MAG: NAD(P)-dependent oxidoreductase [Acidobacteriota bacterium]
MTDSCTPPDITQIEQNFAEIAPLMTQAEALAEANRCLYCYDAPCTQACPTHIDVPSFIKKIASGNVTGSARVIFDANPIGATCARVCPVDVLCEGACVEKTLVNKPIEIGRLQRYATQHVIENGNQLFEKAEPTGKSVGIVGSGPAGLSCATYLSRLGYEVTVYEKSEKPGGLDTYGMAEYKMTQAASIAEVGLVERLGVRFVTNAEVGSEALPFQKLRDDHDAVFIGVGLGSTRMLGVPGEELDGVIDALAFIRMVKTRDWSSVPLGNTVAVIGAGNTAVDAATQAKRLGAERVMLIYRRTEKDAPAYKYELELARKDGIEFHWETMPIEVVGDDKAAGLRCRRRDGNEVLIECDQVIKAIGQTKMTPFFTETFGIEVDDVGRVVVNDSMQTSVDGVFAGGDCVNGGAEAVDAAQMGKTAAKGIHRSLSGEEVRFAGS